MDIHCSCNSWIYVVPEDVINVTMRSLVIYLELISLAFLHIVVMLIIVILILSGAMKPSNVLVMKHSTDN